MKSFEEKQVEKIFKKKVRDYNKVLSPQGTWGEDLEKLGKKTYGDKWITVSDQKRMPIKKIEKMKVGYGIFNNDYSGPGEHWLCIYTKGSMVYVWDSYGRSMDEIVPLLKKRLKSSKIRFQPNDKDSNQTTSQKDCGSRCFAWLECVKELGIRKSMKI